MSSSIAMDGKVDSQRIDPCAGEISDNKPLFAAFVALSDIIISDILSSALIPYLTSSK